MFRKSHQILMIIISLLLLNTTAHAVTFPDIKVTAITDSSIPSATFFGQTYTASYTVINQGTRTAKPITFSYPNPTGFPNEMQTDTAPMPHNCATVSELAPNASCILYVTYTPQHALTVAPAIEINRFPKVTTNGGYFFRPSQADAIDTVAAPIPDTVITVAQPDATKRFPTTGR